MLARCVILVRREDVDVVDAVGAKPCLEAGATERVEDRNRSCPAVLVGGT